MLQAFLFLAICKKYKAKRSKEKEGKNIFAIFFMSPFRG
jgi:hypothetical protein